jgi:hypothetical protein
MSENHQDPKRGITTKEVFEASFEWIASHKIFPEGAMGAGRYEDSVVSLAA